MVFEAQPTPWPAPLGEGLLRRLRAALTEVCPRAALNEAQSTPLSEAHLRRVYVEQHDLMDAESQAASMRSVILSKLVCAEGDSLFAMRRWLKLWSAVDEEALKCDDLSQRVDRLRGELFAAGLVLRTHPSTGERCIQTRKEAYGHDPDFLDDERTNEERRKIMGYGSEDDVGALCADATRVKPAQHVRLRPSRSARPQD